MPDLAAAFLRLHHVEGVMRSIAIGRPPTGSTAPFAYPPDMRIHRMAPDAFTRSIWTSLRYATLVVCKLVQLHHSARVSIVSRGYEYVVSVSAIAGKRVIGSALQQQSKGLHLHKG